MCYDWIGPRKANGFVPAQVGARTPSLNPIGNMSRLLLTVGAVIVAVGLAVTALLAQDDLDATRQAAEQGDAEAQYELGGVLREFEVCPGVALFGSHSVPAYRFGFVLYDAPPENVHERESILCVDVALLGSQSEPARRFGFVLHNASPSEVQCTLTGGVS